ncbi:uncharacterized protein LOC105681374 isoform X1 [Bombus impatiens]|uniref:Uncharacterized protein LOC105681374 isoform X1 n=1 Tax=Bombus impatiens TaxID=132113 RepID=A0A6P3V1U0_BOMIM|nr:uncharacterized protein LOC105681374 isoform X1 [Bombus impatiens]XP_033179123.1 uncharacterized protein LOC105681374 isoform X1 [Bombus impatiens]XP_033179124.1 uncharacterized protein LOC105681374 isoform X1 [Bombus impatiens]
MHGIKRILVFCTLTIILPILLLATPLYLRHNFYADVTYAVMNSDILEITDGISTIFCSAHILRMNRTFNAFQMSHKPEITSYKKHIRLKKSMVLPDDTLEYWGFYLLGGSSVALSVCSRFEGASILVVKGERNLRTCGMLEHHNTQIVEGIFLPEAKKQVKVTFKSNAEQINSNNTIIQNNYNKTLNDIEDILLWDHTLNNTDQNIGAHYPYLNSFMSNMENYEEEAKELLQDKDIQHIKRSLEKETIHTTRRLRHARKRKYKMQMKETRKNITLQERKKAQKNYKINSYFKRDIYNKYSLFLKRLQRSLNLEDNGKDDINNEMNVQDKKKSKKRIKRNQGVVNPTLLFDQGIQHGGNAGNVTDTNEDSSVSSFENELFKCYGGSILMAQEFAPSEKCTDVTYLLNGKHMQAVHNVIEDGYYYYIFYSDNDIVSNDIYALFDIYKPIFHYENITNSCINQTKCFFPINMLSSDRVIVEIPTKDGLEYEIDDVNLLLSSCHPRIEVYIFFPVAVLFFILSYTFV